MPTYLSPGVYMEEVSGGPKPIEAVGTATAAFVGFTEKGPLNAPTLVTNWPQYTRTFGGFVDGAYLPIAMFNYFINGGGNAYVVRIGDRGHCRRRERRRGPAEVRRDLCARESARAPRARSLSTCVREPRPTEAGDLSVEVTDPGEPGDDVFKLQVLQGGKVVETSTTSRPSAARRTSPPSSSTVEADRRSRTPRVGALAVPEKGKVGLARCRATGRARREPPTTTSATSATAPASAGSRRSRTSPCSSCPT